MKNFSAIVLLFVANTISGIAQGISMIAIPWYFAEKGMMLAFVQAYLLTNFLILFWAPYCGTLIDKYNRKHLFLILNAVVGIIILSIAIMGWMQGKLEWYWVVSVFTLTFITYNLHYPNLYAFVQEISEKKYYGSITSYIEIQGQLSSMLAGAGATILLTGVSSEGLQLLGYTMRLPFTLEPWKIHEIFLLDGATYLISFLVILMIRFVPLKERVTQNIGLRAQFKIGIDYLRENTALLVFGIASYFVFVSILMEGFFIGAAYVKDHLQADGSIYAFSEVFYAVGAVFTGLTIRFIFKKTSMPLGIIILTAIAALIFFGLYATKSIAVLFVALFFIGVANAGVRILRTTFLFQKVPNEVFGRTASIFALSNVTFRIILLSIFLIPIFHEENNIIYAFLVLSIFLAVAVLVLWKNYPKIMKVDSVS